MNEPSHCAQCGAPLPAEGAPCPRCLLATGLESGHQPRLDPGFLHDLPLPGDMLVIADKYRVLETIGRGAMGVVYKAAQENLGRIVAVKMLTAGVLAGEEARQRFLQEAKHAASLRHPNIVTVYDWGEDHGQPYFSMEYVEGRSLAAMVRDGPLEIATAVRLLRAIAGAVSYAHEQGIVHRDLKPSNVLLDGGGDPKVADFGLAKQLSDNSGLTLSGQILGTPGYLAPEQASSRLGPVGPASDIYALGALFYCLLTGKPPFLAGTIPDTLRQVVEHDPVPPRQLNPAVPRDLETICLKCLQKEPERRYASAAALERDLSRWEQGQPIEARPVGWAERAAKWTRRHPGLTVASGVAAFCLLLALAGLEWGRRSAVANVQMARTNAIVLSVQLDRATTSADRFQMEQVYRALDHEKHAEALAQLADLLRRSPSNSAAVSLTFDLIQREGWREGGPLLKHEQGAFRIAFRPDGRELLSASWDGAARRWDLSTMQMVGEPLAQDPTRSELMYSASYTADAQRILTVLHTGTAQFWDAASGRPIGQPFQMGYLTHVSDDGRWVSGNAGSVWDLRTGEPSLHPRDEHGDFVTLSPDAGMVLNLFKGPAVLDAQTEQPIGGPFRHETRVFSGVFSPDGLSVLIAAEDRMARLWDTRTSKLIGQPMRHSAFIDTGVFSPDGRLLATAARDGVRIWNTQRNQAVSLIVSHQQSPSALIGGTPSGRRFATVALCPAGVMATREDSWSETIRIWSTSNAGLPKCTIQHPGPVDQMGLTSNGRWLITTAEERRFTLRMLDTVRGDLISGPVHFYDDVDDVKMSIVDCSADGTCVVIRSAIEEHQSDPASPTRSTIQVWDMAQARPRGQPIIEEESGDNPRLSGDGRALVTGLNGKVLRVIDTETGQPIGQPIEHHVPVRAVSVASDNTILAIAVEHQALVYDLHSGKAVGTPMPHEEPIRCLQLKADGTRLVTVSGSRTVRHWDARTGEAIGSPVTKDWDVAFAGFDEDGIEVVHRKSADERNSFLSRYQNSSHPDQPREHHEKLQVPSKDFGRQNQAAALSLEVTAQVVLAGWGRNGRPSRARWRYSRTGKPCLRMVEM